MRWTSPSHIVRKYERKEEGMELKGEGGGEEQLVMK